MAWAHNEKRPEQTNKTNIWSEGNWKKENKRIKKNADKTVRIAAENNQK